MASENIRKKKFLLINEVALVGFSGDVSAAELTEFLEREVRRVWRCRLKRLWTPPDSYPDFSITDTSSIQQSNDYRKVIPHAFVHFELPDSAKEAYEMAGPRELIYNGRALTVELGMESYYRVARRRNITPHHFRDVNVEIGSLVSPSTFLVSWKGPENGVDFLIDPFDGTCRIVFTRDTVFSFQDATKKVVLKCVFKVEFSVIDISNVKFYDERTSVVILLHLQSSPLIYYRTADDDIYVSVPFNLLDDEDPWIRTTDFTINGAIGDCQFYKISFSPPSAPVMNKAKNYFKEQRILKATRDGHLFVKYVPGYDNPVSNLFFSVKEKREISFEVLFLVNCLVHKGIVSWRGLSKFFSLLSEQPAALNIAALQHMYSYRNPIFNARKALNTVQEWLLKKPMLVKCSQLSEYNVEVRRIVITPTKAYCLPPEVELSNRVLREYRDIADRFIRVIFMDEGTQLLNSSVLKYKIARIVKKISSKPISNRTTIYRRVKSIVENGFPLCGRHYTFLAFSSNQLRERSAWFFAEDERITAQSIRTWMGTFDTKNVAKCAARMGQCFSSTYATASVPFNEVNFELPDIKRHGYIFSDGIGIIAPELAREVACKLQLTGDQPSGFQIRYAGCKGMVVFWPNLGDDKRKLSLRPSMNKFQSRHDILEVVAWTHFQPGFLNREIITLLSALGVSNDVFMKMQDSMISKLDEMLKNSDTAFEVLTTCCPELGNSAAIMLGAGFDPDLEPYLRSMLSCIRSGLLKGLLNKSRIFVPQSRWLLGCLDELAMLEHGQCFIQVSNPSLLACFVKHGAKFFERSEPNVQVIKGTVAVAKNPCLHPGDIRILEAVDVPALHHLVDCLVFPQKGDRPHTNEASGSDLDGDIYFVTWDSGLIPPGKKSAPPMDYFPAPSKESSHHVKIAEIMDFFTESMVSDSLGKICHAHVVHADLSEHGAMDEKCIELAKLAAIAVDFPKTGVNATLPYYLKPEEYPDFLRKGGRQSYKSEKILGHLYRKIRGNYQIVVEGHHIAYHDLPYDYQLEIPGYEKFLEDAWSHKCSYDQLIKSLLLQYDVHSEGEIVTGYFVSLPKHDKKKRMAIKRGLRHAYISINKEFRAKFESVGSDLNLSDDDRNSILEKKASAWYYVTYHPHWVRKTMELSDPEKDEVHLQLSFPWIAADYLARIKIFKQQEQVEKPTFTRPINSWIGQHFKPPGDRRGTPNIYKMFRVDHWISSQLIPTNPSILFFLVFSILFVFLFFLLAKGYI